MVRGKLTGQSTLLDGTRMLGLPAAARVRNFSRVFQSMAL
jgi:hypothetical protein